MATSKEMTVGPALPLLLKFTMPLLMGNLLQQTYSLVDAAIVGKFLGIHSLASVGASTSVIFLILGFCNGCCGGFAIPVAQKFGARDYSTMRTFISVSQKLAVGMSVAVAFITSLLCADILRLMQTPQNIFDGAYQYLLVTFIGIPFTFFYNLLSSIIRALGDSKTPFWFLLLSTVLNIFLDLFFILMLGWGVAGAKNFALIFVEPTETEILRDTELFLHVACSFFPALGLLCILRYTIQGVGFTNLAMFSGVAEMIARIAVSLYAVPAFGFLAVCFGDPMAWVAADLFLIPAFACVYKRIKKRKMTPCV